MDLNFRRGDILLSAPGFKAACYCILDVAPFRPSHPYTGLNLVNLQLYRLAGNGLTRIGTATEEFLKDHVADGSAGESGENPAQDLRYRRGQMRAARAAWEASGDDQKRWMILASAKPGDPIHVQFQCAHPMPTFTFRFVLERGSRYVFVADDAKGASSKLTLDVVSLEQPALKLLSNPEAARSLPQ